MKRIFILGLTFKIQNSYKLCYDYTMLEEMRNIEQQIDIERLSKNMDAIFVLAKKLKDLAENERDDYYMAVACYYIANYNLNKCNYQEALDFALDGITYGEIISANFYLIQLNNLVGMIYGTLGDEVNSVQYTLKAYYIAKMNNVNRSVYILTNNLGVLFYDLQYYDIAYEYFLESFKERGITDSSLLKINDGFNIINLVGCSLHLHKMDDYRQWMSYLEVYREKYTEFTVEDDYLLYQVYEAYYAADYQLMIERIYQFLNLCSKDLDQLHTYKDMVQIFKLCVEVGFEELSNVLLEQLNIYMKQYPEYKRTSRLMEYYVEYSIKFRKEQLKDVLFNYYLSKKKEDEAWKREMKSTLITNINMEKIVYEQKIILKTNEELRKNMELEEFTRVLNKNAFTNYVKAELEMMHQDQYMALFIVDIDKFKNINDTLGHYYGDQVLIQIVEAIKKNLRDNDYLGRIGGDEFSIFMKNILSMDYLNEKTENIMKSIQSIAGECQVSASVGLSVISQKCDFESLFKSADEAMYEAKNNGGNRYCLKMLDE